MRTAILATFGCGIRPPTARPAEPIVLFYAGPREKPMGR